LHEFDLYGVRGMYRWWGIYFKKKDGGGISNIQQVGLSRCEMVSKAPKDNNLHTDE